MITLAEQNPETYERLKASRPNVAKLFTMFHLPKEIDQALGINHCAAHWVAGRNGVSGPSEKRAERYLASLDSVSDQTSPSTPSTETTFLVVAPADKADKVSKVLEMMGCQMVEV